MPDGGAAPEALSKRGHELARALGLSLTTIRSHVRAVYSKLGVTSKIEPAQRMDSQSTAPENRDPSDIVADLALELDDAVRRERVLAKVLRTISTDGGPLEAVIDDLLDQSLEICEAEFAILFDYHCDLQVSELRSRGMSPEFGDWLSDTGTFEVEPTTGVGRAAAELRPVSISDVRAGGLS